MQAYYRTLVARARFLHVSEELEITTAKSFDVIEKIASDPTLTLPREVSIVLLFGFSVHLPIDRASYDAAIERSLDICRNAKVIPHLTVGTAIHPTFAHPGPERPSGQPLPAGKHDIREVAEWVASDERVESFRVGLEDTPEMYGRKPSNAELVDHARGIFEGLDVQVELNVARVRRTFGLMPAYSQLHVA